MRELLLRDLGGFTYEVHRTAGGTAQEPQRRLTAAKAERISALDAEVLALEARLGEPHAEPLLREPGIGGTCRECGELHASDAHFCSRCGAPLDEQARAQRAAEQPATPSEATVEPQPASVLWAGGPRPAPEPQADEEEAAPEPSAVTSQWLATDQPTTFERPAPADEPVASGDEPAAAEPVAGERAAADEPARRAGRGREPAAEPAADEPAQPDEAAPPAPATAAARAKPKRAAKPRKPAKRAPAKPRAKAPKPETKADDFTANGRSDEDVPPPLSAGDPLASPQERRP